MRSALARLLGAGRIRLDDDDLPAGELEWPRMDSGEAELEHPPWPVSQQLEDAWRRGSGKGGRKPVHERDANVRLPGCLDEAEITPVEPDPGHAGEGSALIPRCITIAGSDSGGGAGIQADLKAFAAAGAHGMTAIVALTAQNTRGVTAVHEVPPGSCARSSTRSSGTSGRRGEDGDALLPRDRSRPSPTGSRSIRVPLVVDPVMVASSGARLLEDEAVEVLVGRLFPLATVVTPNVLEARALTGSDASPARAGRGARRAGRAAALVTGGHGEEPVDHLFDGNEHHEIPVERHDVAATHGAGLHALRDARRAACPRRSR